MFFNLQTFLLIIMLISFIEGLKIRKNIFLHVWKGLGPFQTCKKIFVYAYMQICINIIWLSIFREFIYICYHPQWQRSFFKGRECNISFFLTNFLFAHWILFGGPRCRVSGSITMVRLPIFQKFYSSGFL